MYQRYLANVNQLEDQFAALWTQCQRCQVLLPSILPWCSSAVQAANNWVCSEWAGGSAIAVLLVWCSSDPSWPCVNVVVLPASPTMMSVREAIC